MEVAGSQIPLEALESIRNRLNQVHLSLRKLADQINHYNRFPGRSRLPTYGQFQYQFHVLITQLHSITNILEANEEVLSTTNAYPLPSFPAAQQEGLLTTLLRKKPLPEVDEWIEEALTKVKDLNLNSKTDDEFSQWCSTTIAGLKENFEFYGFLSSEELAELETPEGKKEAQRKKDVAREKEDAELSVTDGGKKGMHPNAVLKFMCQGKLE